MNRALCIMVTAACLLALPQTAGSQTVQAIPVNPDYASPAKDTRSGAEVNSGSLVENANQWNGRTISFKGEAIGEAFVQEHMAWIHVNDDAYMEKSAAAGGPLSGYNSGHAIWLRADLARKVGTFGDYRHQGDIVQVTGIFNAACPDHGGDMDIHATSLKILRPGRPIPHPITTVRGLAVIALFALAGGLYGVRRKPDRRGL